MVDWKRVAEYAYFALIVVIGIVVGWTFASVGQHVEGIVWALVILLLGSLLGYVLFERILD